MTNTALITGASGGIGYEIAKILACEKHNLVLVARNESKLREIKSELGKESINVHIIAKDLSRPDSARELFDELTKAGIHIDILINNVGIGLFGPFHDTDIDDASDLLQLNVVFLTLLTRLCLTDMVKNNHGYILNVASVAAFQPGPLMALYYASKAYILSFSNAVSKEVQNSGVKICALCPGPVKTGFEDAAEMGNSGLFRNLPVKDAHSVAKYGLKAMRRGKTTAVHGFVNKCLIFTGRFIPRRLSLHLVYKMQK